MLKKILCSVLCKKILRWWWHTISLIFQVTDDCSWTNPNSKIPSRIIQEWLKKDHSFYCNAQLHINHLWCSPRKTEGPRAYSHYMGSSARAEWPTFLPSYTSNEMTLVVSHFDVLKKYMIIMKMCFSVNQIDYLQSTNKKQSWTFRLPWCGPDYYL